MHLFPLLKSAFVIQFSVKTPLLDLILGDIISMIRMMCGGRSDPGPLEIFQAKNPIISIRSPMIRFVRSLEHTNTMKAFRPFPDTAYRDY
jgi:hypothetical protein